MAFRLPFQKRLTNSIATKGNSPIRMFVSYGLGDAGTGLAASQLGFYLFAFFTCTAGLPAFIAGSLLMVIKVWDGINDPLIGWLSDHTQSRWGPRLPWMIGASAPLGITLAAIWWVPPGSITSKTIYFILIAVLLMTAYTSVNLPYSALSVELTKSTSIRTRLNASRFTGSILASLTGLIVASLLTNQGETGFIAMGRIAGTLATLATLLCCWGLAPFAKKAQRPKRHKEPFRLQIYRILQNPLFLKVLSLYLVLWCALQLMQPVALIYLVQAMHVPTEQSTWLLVVFQVSALVGLQIWTIYSNHYGRIKALFLGGGLWIGGCTIAMFLKPLTHSELSLNGLNSLAENNSYEIVPLLLTIILVGFGASTAYLIPWSLLPDAVDWDPEKPSGMYTAWMVLIQKIGIGLSIQILGLLLSFSGYKSAENCSGAMSFITQPESALVSIRLCMGLIPAFLVIVGLLLMRNWPEKQPTLKKEIP